MRVHCGKATQSQRSMNRPNLCIHENDKNRFSIFIHNRQFEFRMDKQLPFYVWTLNERFTEEELPSFDEIPGTSGSEEEQYVPRLHRLNRRSREDSSIIGGGRAMLPVRHATSIRHRLYRVPEELPSLPEELEESIREFRDGEFVVS